MPGHSFAARPFQARYGRPKNQARVEVVCIIGERVYHAPGSECHGKLVAQGNVLSLTDGQAHEVGMEPCGYCIVLPETERDRRT